MLWGADHQGPVSIPGLACGEGETRVEQSRKGRNPLIMKRKENARGA